MERNSIASPDSVQIKFIREGEMEGVLHALGELGYRSASVRAVLVDLFRFVVEQPEVVRSLHLQGQDPPSLEV